MQRINERVVQLNHAEANPRARYVLYWMQMYKRTSHNHALTFAIRKANDYNLPLVVYEGLKYYYPVGQRPDSRIYPGRRRRKAARRLLL